MKNEYSLIISETFYSIQGEGYMSGMPSVFLRLAGCNLLCEGKGWRCDTIEVWKHGRAVLFKDALSPDYIRNLRAGAHLIITGGEPLLHQDAIVNYLKWFVEYIGFLPVVEIETNGTISPSVELLKRVRYWNVSFKLSTSGEPYARRINEAALRGFNILNNSTFKIVISCEADIQELVQDFDPILDFTKIILMPAGATQDELILTRPIVAEACKGLNLRYCDRLHIVIWNQKTGV